MHGSESHSSALRTHQNYFRPGLCPGPRWGSSRCSPRYPSRLGRGYPLPISNPPGHLDPQNIPALFFPTSSTGCNNMHIDVEQPTYIMTLNVTMHLALYTFSAFLSLTEFPFTLDFPTFPAPCILHFIHCSCRHHRAEHIRLTT